MERLLPKHIHAVTVDGFELKTIPFVFASSILPIGGNLGYSYLPPVAHRLLIGVLPR